MPQKLVGFFFSIKTCLKSIACMGNALSSLWFKSRVQNTFGPDYENKGFACSNQKRKLQSVFMLKHTHLIQMANI